MKINGEKIFWGILVLLTAVALLMYGAGFGFELFGLPLYKLILCVVIGAFILHKILFADSLGGRLRVFTLLALLFMVLESNIAVWISKADGNLINNWLLFFAGILLDIGVTILIPKTHKHGGMHCRINNGDINIGNCDNTDGADSTLSGVTHFVDASKQRQHFFTSKMGAMHIYYQNTDSAEDGSEYRLELHCKMSSMVVHVPEDWVVNDNMTSKMGSTVIHDGNGERVKLILTGSNSMGSIVVTRE